MGIDHKTTDFMLDHDVMFSHNKSRESRLQFR